MTPCPCARKWLAEMVEEGMRRRPEGEGAAWVLGWLLSESSLPMRRADGIIAELSKAKRASESRAIALRRQVCELKREWAGLDAISSALTKAARPRVQKQKNELGEKIIKLEEELDKLL